VDEATRKANYFHAQAMLDYFGSAGYNVLTEEQTAKYEQMVADNQ
jgi:multiple sugar transport system substrate-binding protein